MAAGRDLIRIPEPCLILVTVPALPDLVALSVRLSAAGIAHLTFREEDMGERVTALATEPILQKDRKHFRDLPLFKIGNTVREAA